MPNSIINTPNTTGSIAYAATSPLNANAIKIGNAIIRRATKIYMPSDIAGVVSTLGVIGETLGIGDATAVDHSEKPKPPIQEDPCIRKETGKGGIDAYVTTETIKNDVETDRF